MIRKSDTPRTDLEEATQTQRFGGWMVKSAFARQLERENAAMSEVIKEAYAAIAAIYSPIGDETPTSGNPCITPKPQQGRALAVALAKLSPFLQ